MKNIYCVLLPANNILESANREDMLCVTTAELQDEDMLCFTASLIVKKRYSCVLSVHLLFFFFFFFFNLYW